MSAAKRRIYGLALLDEIGPLLAVFTLWFIDHGVRLEQLSAVFVFWAALAVGLEVPGGALADRVNKPRLLAVAYGFRAVGIASWLVSPTVPGLVTGAALWAISDALSGGAWEAMIHDQLRSIGEERSYVVVMARVGQFNHVGLAIGAGLAAVLLWLGLPMARLGWMTVAIHLPSIWLVVGLSPETRPPETRPPETRPPETRPSATGLAESSTIVSELDIGGWWAGLIDGVREACSTRSIAGAIGIGALVDGLFVLDEYLPALARAEGGDAGTAAALLVALWVGLLVGGEVVARHPNLSPMLVGALLTAGGGVALLAYSVSNLWLLVLVGWTYGSMELAWTISDARLQERVGSANRATVSSVRSFLAALVAIGVFTGIGALTVDDDPRRGLIVCSGLLVIAGIVAVSAIPPSATGRES